MLAAAFACIIAPATTMLRATPEIDAGLKFFREKIEPVLMQQCYECHSAQAKKLKAGLRLDSRAGLLVGGDSGPALAPGDLKSLLLLALLRRRKAISKCPVRINPKLASAIIADFEHWVAIGAPAHARRRRDRGKSRRPTRGWRAVSGRFNR